eukprot:TRINITY_DN516_c0_g1_i17.p1 TRINITY_DN516_c0_g1~~TRINITY_DN516_c0_g1_i17.p1  ORF type:complete len:364 (+),score=29.58 TRINITY_DN516_c0_g1_i17:254-1345(+)
MDQIKRLPTPESAGEKPKIIVNINTTRPSTPNTALKAKTNEFKRLLRQLRNSQYNSSVPIVHSARADSRPERLSMVERYLRAIGRAEEAGGSRTQRHQKAQSQCIGPKPGVRQTYSSKYYGITDGKISVITKSIPMYSHCRPATQETYYQTSNTVKLKPNANSKNAKQNLISGPNPLQINYFHYNSNSLLLKAFKPTTAQLPDFSEVPSQMKSYTAFPEEHAINLSVKKEGAIHTYSLPNALKRCKRLKIESVTKAFLAKKVGEAINKNLVAMKKQENGFKGSKVTAVTFIKSAKKFTKTALPSPSVTANSKHELSMMLIVKPYEYNNATHQKAESDKTEFDLIRVVPRAKKVMIQTCKKRVV